MGMTCIPGLPSRRRRSVRGAVSSSLVALAACLLLTACAEHMRDIGTVEIVFLEENRVMVSAIQDGRAWLVLSGVRDTLWRTNQVGPDGTGFVHSIKYDLVRSRPGPCYLFLNFYLESSETLPPPTLSVGYAPQAPPFLRPALTCPGFLEDLRVGVERLKAARLHFVDGELRFDAKAWPALVGRFAGHLALHSFSAY